MKKQTLQSEGAACTRMESGDLLISRRRVRGVFVIVFGLLLALGGVWMFILSLLRGPLKGLLYGGVLLALGGLLAYVGYRALTGPEISIEVADRLIHVRARGSQSAQMRSFDDLSGPVEVTTMDIVFPLEIVRLRFLDGEPLTLCMTGDKKKSQAVVQWLEEAFAPPGMPSDCPACGAWNAPGIEVCGECGVALGSVAA